MRPERNRLHNATNPYQGSYKKVLCVCSAGMLRAPTAAVVLSRPPYDFNTRAVGTDLGTALIPSISCTCTGRRRNCVHGLRARKTPGRAARQGGL